MLNFNSLAFKNAIIYLILFLTGIGLTGFLLLQNSSKEILQSTEKSLLHSGDLIQIKFNTYLTDLRNDLTHISKSPYLHAFLDGESQLGKRLINEEYKSLLSSKEDYAQIRFIGIEENGKEIIRVERNSDSIQIVSEQELQIKGGRDYFLETIELEPDSMYISPINLNREYNKISIPYTPTLRVAYPVYHHGNLEGIIVINADLRVLFTSLNQILDEKTKLRVLNQDGYYLMHDDAEQLFGFEFGHSSTFFEEFGKSPDALSKEYDHVFYNEGQLHYMEQLSFPKKDYKIFSIVSANKQDLLSDYYIWRRNSFIIITGLALSFMLLAFIYMNRQSGELKEITNKLKIFPQKLAVSDLPVHRKDEIGDLAKSFEEMSKVVANNINSLNQAKLEAEEAVQEKIEFMENMSHEIRNPLQSISGLSELLEKNAPAAHQQKIIKSLRFNTANLQNLVNDILDYKRLIRGDFKLNEEWVSLDDLLEEVHGSHNYLAVTKKIQFKLEIDENLKHQEIFIDKTRINQILHNLILNAIKFTPERGKVTLRLNLKDKNEQKDLLEFSVSDTGLGMNKETIQQIQQRYFTRSEQSGVIEGFGLGLNIVVQILNYLQSSLEIKSEEGKGSNFSFRLLLRKRNFEKRKENDPQNKPTGVLERLNVLVIDDDEQILELYTHLFDGTAKHFTCISSPLALANDSKLKFDIILSDYQLNGSILNNFITQLQSVSKENTLLYIVTAQHELEGLSDFGMAVQDKIQKPFNNKKLLLLIEEDYLTQKYGKPDLSSIQEDYDHDELKIQHAIQLLLREWESILVKISHSIQSGDREAYRQLVHKMITSVRRLDLIKFEELLNDIDLAFDQGSANTYLSTLQEAMQFYLSSIRKFAKEH